MQLKGEVNDKVLSLIKTPVLLLLVMPHCPGVFLELGF